ncbi:hypothetical protein [Metabacillus fastidiosus]|uniref:hypothetical protein n=1 Tax=Metabacillus fastidiosus TaxID=1458 RepID=UPI002DB85E22|nr:hypothetical protein [Metabacillus fastidiosus]MEC2077332.1 hypothetical protein [Metabacillus fastidiosus]MED4532918.1 hypothetical protein [Metabacillus fastidiosus]
MDEQTITEILDQLRDSELRTYEVSKEDFLEFRKVLIKRDDFKHFRGIAQQGGSVIYEYLQEARS